MGVLKNRVGDVYGRLTVLSLVGVVDRRSIWLCRCECGVVKEIPGHSLEAGKTLSCGCFNKENHTTHGMKKTPEYQTWLCMRHRCYYPKDKCYAEYGGRGIKVCEDWRNSFAYFITDMGEKPSPAHSIERIDVNGDYTPENCRWALPKEQGRNKRNNLIIDTPWGKMTAMDAAEKSDIPYDTFWKRLGYGWSTEKLFSPVRRNGPIRKTK